MLSDEVIEKVIERLTRRIEQTNIEIIKRIGANVKQLRKLKPSDAQNLIQILRYGGDYDKIVKALAEMTQLSVQDIYKIFDEVARSDYMFSKQFYDYRNEKFIPFDENVALKQQVDAIARHTAQEFVKLTKTMVFAKKVGDKIIYSPIAEVYNDILDKAVLSTLQGKNTFDVQLHQAIKELASNGIKTANYESGKVLRLDSAVRMQMKDALRTLHNEQQKIVGEQFKSDGVEISVHLNPAPDHEEVQGKQFSTNKEVFKNGKVVIEKGEFEKFQDDEDAVSYDGVEFSANYNGHDRRSIGQYNCYHYVFAIVLGVSKPQYTNEELKEIIKKNKKGFEFDGKHYTNYQGTQLQRNIEVAIRKLKDELMMNKASGFDDEARKNQKKINQLTKKYKQLCDASGLKSKVQRMKVAGFKRIATK